MSARTRWLGIIIGLLVGNAVAVFILMRSSAGEARRRVLPDYYQRAANWDSTMAAQAASDALGWKVDAKLAGRELTLVVTDAAGTPVGDAKVEVTAVPRGHVDETVKSVAVTVTAGVYRTALLGQRGGLHDVHLDIVRGNDHYLGDQLLELARP